jgi:hypothetical protein
MLEDEQYVQEMFEQIVAAQWPPTPQAPARIPPGDRGIAVAADRPGPLLHRARPIAQRRLHRPGTERWARERSPPPIPSTSATNRRHRHHRR